MPSFAAKNEVIFVLHKAFLFTFSHSVKQQWKSFGVQSFCYTYTKSMFITSSGRPLLTVVSFLFTSMTCLHLNSLLMEEFFK